MFAVLLLVVIALIGYNLWVGTCCQTIIRWMSGFGACSIMTSERPPAPLNLPYTLVKKVANR